MKSKYSANDIEVLTGAEAIRKRPQMYFDRIFEEASLDSLPLEALCHAIDEHVDGNCQEISISIRGKHVSIRYDAGMTLTPTPKQEYSQAELIMTSLFACRNLKKHMAVGEDFCEMGMAAVNAACDWLELQTAHEGKRGSFRFEKGLTVSREIKAWEGKGFTELNMMPDPQLFEDLGFSEKGLNKQADRLKIKYPGLQVRLNINTEQDG